MTSTLSDELVDAIKGLRRTRASRARRSPAGASAPLTRSISHAKWPLAFTRIHPAGCPWGRYELGVGPHLSCRSNRVVGNDVYDRAARLAKHEASDSPLLVAQG